MSSASVHIPVLAREVLESLEPRAGQIIVDGTLGGGSHTRLLAEHVGPTGLVIALDRDAAAIARAERQLRGLPVKVAQSDYRDLPDVLDELRLPAVDGILLDIGLSSDQLADPARGFSFSADGPLDMRFDPESGEPASRLLERLDEHELADILYRYGEEHQSRRIARAIVRQRELQPVQTAGELAELIRKVMPRKWNDTIDPATRTFQALRIAVNDELGALRQALERFPKRLKLNGRLAVISFHSLEDRLVKESFRDHPRFEPLTKKPLTAAEDELAVNPRSRSAKLRVARRIAVGSLKKIISGGQTGVDRGALDAARALGIDHGGWCPKGRLSENGAIPAEYLLRETESSQYQVRTERNVMESDATMIIARGEITGGTELTRQYIARHSKPFEIVDMTKPPPVGKFLEWLTARKIGTLNLAGPRESGSPGIQAAVTDWLVRLLREAV